VLFRSGGEPVAACLHQLAAADCWSRPTPTIRHHPIAGSQHGERGRELRANDLDRPVIAQDFAFPVGTKAVEFKGISFDVASVTPTGIAFTVTALMPLRELPPMSAPAPAPKW
jgi:hypothetical protein